MIPFLLKQRREETDGSGRKRSLDLLLDKRPAGQKRRDPADQLEKIGQERETGKFHRKNTERIDLMDRILILNRF